MTPSPSWQAPRSPASTRPPGSSSGTRTGRRTPSRTPSSDAWRDLPTLRDPDRFDAWLHRLLVNACIDEIRRIRRHHLDVDITDVSDLRRPPTPRRSSPTATSSSAASAVSSPRSGRSSSCITTSTCRCRRSRRRWGSRSARPNPACTAACGRCERRSTPTLGSARDTWKAVRHEPQRQLRPHRRRVAPRGCRASGAGSPRCRGPADPHGTTATGWSSLERWLPVDTATDMRGRITGPPLARLAGPDRPGHPGDPGHRHRHRRPARARTHPRPRDQRPDPGRRWVDPQELSLPTAAIPGRSSALPATAKYLFLRSDRTHLAGRVVGREPVHGGRPPWRRVLDRPAQARRRWWAWARHWSPDDHGRSSPRRVAPIDIGHGLESSTSTAAGWRTLDSADRLWSSRRVCHPTAGLVFRGEQLSGRRPAEPGIFAVRPDGSGLRPLSSRPATASERLRRHRGVTGRSLFVHVRRHRSPAVIWLDIMTGIATGRDRVLLQPTGHRTRSLRFSPGDRSARSPTR